MMKDKFVVTKDEFQELCKFSDFKAKETVQEVLNIIYNNPKQFSNLHKKMFLGTGTFISMKQATLLSNWIDDKIELEVVG